MKKVIVVVMILSLGFTGAIAGDKTQTEVFLGGEYIKEFGREGLLYGAYAPFKISEVMGSENGCSVFGAERLIVSCGQHGCTSMAVNVRVLSKDPGFCRSVTIDDTIRLVFKTPGDLLGVELVKTNGMLIPYIDSPSPGGYYEVMKFGGAKLNF